MSDLTQIKVRILDIIDGTIVDGPGLRTSIYFAGCAHACPGCHNPQSWDFNGGYEVTLQQLVDHVIDNGFNVTLTGGDPMYQIDNILPLCDALHDIGKTIWLYTGYTIDEISKDPSKNRITEAVDVIVDGPFIEDLRDISLHFRGSSNQKIIETINLPSNKVLSCT